MKIAMMTNNYLPYVGGVPISVDRLSHSLRALGHRVDIFAPSYGNDKEEEGVIRCRSFKRKKDQFCTPNLFDKNIEKAFRENDYDIVHVHHPIMAGYAALHLSKKFHVPLVFTYHTRYEQYLHHLRPLNHIPGAERVVKGHNRLFTNHCDLVFAPTESMRTYLGENGTHTPVEVLPTGLVPDDFLKDSEVSASIRKGLGFGREKIYCTVSRLEEEKNVDFLVRSFAEYKKIAGHRFRLVIIGDGSQRKALEALAIELGLEDDVVFTGCLPHQGLSYWYGACDAFVFASRSETQGIVLLEAMAAGLPIVAVEASGVDDVVVNNVNGFRTCHDESAFAQITSLLANQPGRLEALGEGALHTAHTYTAENTALKAQASYYTLLAQKEAEQVAYSAH